VSDGIDRVLVTNDDGIGSAGLEALVERLAESADVTVVAPDENVSGIGRTRSREVTYERTDRGYAVDGTPADCVAFGARALDEPFDAVVSGCNHGPNAGA
jgi:5'-nucleotidase